MATEILPRLMLFTAVVWLAGCSPEHFDRPGADGDEALYTSMYPYYAEFCALSQIKKKVGFGADIRGEIGSGIVESGRAGKIVDRRHHIVRARACAQVAHRN